MTALNEKVIGGLRQLGALTRMTYVAQVTAVDEAAATCTVELPGGLPLEDVQLRTIKEATNGLLLIPKVGTTVTLLNVGHPDWQVLDAEELDKAITTIGTSKLTMTADGFKIERGAESLTKLITDLVQAIEQLTVTTSTGPSGVPINLAAFKQVEQRIDKLLK